MLEATYLKKWYGLEKPLSHCESKKMYSLVLCFDAVSLSTWVIPSLLAGAKGKGYGTFHEEAIRIFNSLQEQESIADPIPVIQVIIKLLVVVVVVVVVVSC